LKIPPIIRILHHHQFIFIAYGLQKIFKENYTHNCRCSYSFFILCVEFPVVYKPYKFWESYSHHTQGLSGLFEQIKWLWTDVIYVKRFYFEVKWSELLWIYCEFLGDKSALCIRMTLQWGYLIILWLFHLGISCTVFVLTCVVVVLTCIVFVLTCIVVVLTCILVVLTCIVVVLNCIVVVLTCIVVFNLFCKVWVCVCVNFVMCGCFVNMYICIYCVSYCLNCVFCIVSFMYIYSCSFCLY
jgi:hypothetical protein